MAVLEVADVASDAAEQKTVPPPSRSAAEAQVLGARLAAFAVGCLGAASVAKAGTRLGLMGSADEEEFRYVLCHLEVLSRQQAAKLAGLPFDAWSEGCGAPAVSGAVPTRSCSEAFAAAVRDACGTDIVELFLKLPADGRGRADLLRVFEMSENKGPPSRLSILASASPTKSDARVELRILAGDIPCDYVDVAAELASSCTAAAAAAEAQVLQTTVSEAAWATDLLALNILRSTLVHSKGQHRLQITDSLISGVVSRCSSKRPALAKSALRTLMELASSIACEAPEEAVPSRAWADAAEVAVRGCLAAARGTKLVARLAEDALAAVVRRVAGEADPPLAARALTACVAVEAGARPPQPTVVAAGLRALCAVVPQLAGNGTGEEVSAAVAIADLCRTVLEDRRLAPAFSQARALLQALPAVATCCPGKVGKPSLAAEAPEQTAV